MKRALLGAVLAASVLTAQAREIWVSQTEEGGEIVLTLDRVTSCGDALYWMYVVTKSQDLLSGCWAAIDNRIMVRFEGGQRRAYDPRGFVKREVQ